RLTESAAGILKLFEAIPNEYGFGPALWSVILQGQSLDGHPDAPGERTCVGSYIKPYRTPPPLLGCLEEGSQVTTQLQYFCIVPKEKLVLFLLTKGPQIPRIKVSQ